MSWREKETGKNADDIEQMRRWGDIRSRRIALATMCKSMATGYEVMEKGVKIFATVHKGRGREVRRYLLGEGFMMPGRDHSPRPDGTSQRQSLPTVKRAS